MYGDEDVSIGIDVRANQCNMVNIDACRMRLGGLPIDVRAAIEHDTVRERKALANAQLIAARNNQTRNVTWVGRHSIDDTQPDRYDVLRNMRGSNPMQSVYPFDELHASIVDLRQRWVRRCQNRWIALGEQNAPYSFRTGQYVRERIENNDLTPEAVEMVRLADLYSDVATAGPAQPHPITLGDMLSRAGSIVPPEKSVLFSVAPPPDVY